jgi:hypothetical protein
MAAATQKIGEIDVVLLREAVGDWPAGSTGTVVIDFGKDKMVDIDSTRGDDLDRLVTVPAEKLELLHKYSD